MYENPKFNQNNEKILCERNGKNSDMLMDIRVKILKAGETMTFCEAENETALLLMAGDVDFVFDEKTKTIKIPKEKFLLYKEKQTVRGKILEKIIKP